MKAKKVFSYLDAAAVLAVITAFMYFVGYIYHDSYYRYFGVDLAMFPRAGADYVITAWEYAFWSTFWLLILAFVRSAVAYIFPIGFRLKIRASIPRFVWPMVWILALTIALISVERMGRRGLRDAKTDAAKKRVVRISTTGGLELPDRIYFLSYSQGKYLLYYFPTPDERPNVIVVNDSAIAKIEFPKVENNDTSNKKGLTSR